MNTGTVVITGFFASLILSIIGAYLKITHAAGADTWLWISFVAWVVFIIAAIYEVVNSTTINRSEKIMWVVGFILLGSITGIVYLILGRKRVVAKARLY